MLTTRTSSRRDILDRENEALELLSDIIVGQRPLDPEKIDYDLRQLGYLASLAKLGPYDPQNKLLSLEKLCRAALKPAGPTRRIPGQAGDTAQAAWGAPWHMDAQKLRRDLPLHITKKRRAMV